MITPTLTFKDQTLYVAYAPLLDVCAYGGCRDEALNNLTEEVRSHSAEQPTGEKGKSYAA
jgi:hypothetical protein